MGGRIEGLSRFRLKNFLAKGEKLVKMYTFSDLPLSNGEREREINYKMKGSVAKSLMTHFAQRLQRGDFAGSKNSCKVEAVGGDQLTTIVNTRTV